MINGNDYYYIQRSEIWTDKSNGQVDHLPVDITYIIQLFTPLSRSAPMRGNLLFREVYAVSQSEILFHPESCNQVVLIYNC